MKKLISYYKIKFVISIGIILCWVLVADIGCKEYCSSGEISYISVVVSITESFDLYFTYVIYSASVLTERGQINTSVSPSVRIEPEIPSNYNQVQHFGVRAGVNINEPYDSSLFERTDFMVAMPVDSSTDDIKPPPLDITIKIQDYTKRKPNEDSDANISS